MMQKRPEKALAVRFRMLSVPHLIVIFIVALIVFGPEKMPELARNLGKIMAEFRRRTGDLRSTFEGHLRDMEREADRGRSLRRASPAAAIMPTAAPAAAPGAETRKRCQRRPELSPPNRRMPPRSRIQAARSPCPLCPIRLRGRIRCTIRISPALISPLAIRPENRKPPSPSKILNE